MCIPAARCGHLVEGSHGWGPGSGRIQPRQRSFHLIHEPLNFNDLDTEQQECQRAEVSQKQKLLVRDNCQSGRRVKNLAYEWLDGFLVACVK